MVFAVAGILFSASVLGVLGSWLGYATVTVMAFTGSLLTTFLVYWLASSKGYTSVVTMLLAGVAITALGGALTGLMTYFSDEDELRDITFWTLGSLGGANWQMLALLVPLVLLPAFILWRQSSQLDLLLLGEREAAYTGVNTQRTKWIVISCAALIVGACVAVSGVIAFVALVVPHLVRLIQGPRHRSLLLGSALLGGLLMVWADTAARTLIAPAELPIGILTALLGAPFFIWLLLKTKRSL
jgi:iron complex transport system permease protein